MIPVILKNNIRRINSELNSSPLNKKLINGWEMLHNEAVYSGIYGDISIYEGLPYFFDGKNVIFNGFRLSQSKLSITNILKKFSNEFIDKKQFNFETLNYWGIEEPDDRIHPSLIRREKEKPNENNRDVILKLKEIKLMEIYNLRFVKKAMKAGLTCQINEEKQIKKSHLALIDFFYKNHKDIDLDGKKYIENWRTVLEKPDSILFEIYNKNRMTGMIILNLFFKRMPTYAYGFFDNSVKGTSDLGYAAMIEYCKILDFVHLDLGYSVKETLLKYKMKWGPVTLRKAPWYVTWTKEF